MDWPMRTKPAVPHAVSAAHQQQQVKSCRGKGDGSCDSRSLDRLLVFFGLPFRASVGLGAKLKMRGWLRREIITYSIILSAAPSASRTQARAQGREAGTLIRGQRKKAHLVLPDLMRAQTQFPRPGQQN